MAAPTPNDVAQLKPIFSFHRTTAELPQDAPLEDLPQHWQRAITKLRKENAKTRIELRQSREALVEAQQRIATQICDIADLKAAAVR